MTESIAYIPGLPPTSTEPLARFLPPLPAGVAKKWLENNYPSTNDSRDQQWILDPFGTSPRLIVEIAQSGYCILVAANNPIARFLIEITANPPEELELQSVLAELAASRKGDERLELHIRSLYSSECNQCGSIVEAESFIWEKRPGEERLDTSGDKHKSSDKADNKFFEGYTPVLKIYKCENCGSTGEQPTNNNDRLRAAQFSSGHLHFARALERIAPPGDPDRRYAEEALSTYLPRSIYALQTLINKVEGLNLIPDQLKYLKALLLTTFDQTNTLWSHPTGRARPRSLVIPTRFIENNAWVALEESIPKWVTGANTIPITNWPEPLNSSFGICIFEGRLKDLVGNLHNYKIGSVITALPRPNQAYWTLSALWSGWLWGHELVGPFKSVLRRRRYDWSWHSTALNSALASLFNHIENKTMCLALIGETEPGFLSSALIAGAMAGFSLSGFAMRADIGQAQIIWERDHKKPKKASAEEQSIIAHQAARNFLLQRGEPSNYNYIHYATLKELALKQRLIDENQSPADNLSKFNKVVEEIFTSEDDFIRFHGSEKSLDVGQWWLREPSNADTPISDRIEMRLVKQFLEKPLSSTIMLDKAICRSFPGLHTPSTELFHICLDSYGEQYPPNSNQWRIRQEDEPNNRRIELKQIKQTLISLGKNLGYKIYENNPILLLDRQGEIIFACYIITSAIISNILFKAKYPPAKSLIILPGSRANLVAYKIQKDPRLSNAVDQGWRFVKFRLVRWLANNPVLSLDILEDHIAQEILTYESPQLRMF